MNWQRTVFASMICLPLAACVADEELDDELEELGTTESLLCSDGAADATVAFIDKGGTVKAMSALPSNNYDHPDCSDRFTVEFTGVSQATQPFHVNGGWSSAEALPNTQAGCELAFGNVQTHEYKQTWTCSGQFCFPVYGWHQVGGDIMLRGHWGPQPPFGISYGCNLVADSPLPTLQPNFARSKVRVAVRAYGWALFFPVYKRAEAGLFSPQIPL